MDTTQGQLVGSWPLSELFSSLIYHLSDLYLDTGKTTSPQDILMLLAIPTCLPRSNR